MRQAMSLSSRRDLIRATYERYQKSKSRARKEVLDEFVAATSYHRTNALEVLSHPPPESLAAQFLEWHASRAAECRDRLVAGQRVMAATKWGRLMRPPHRSGVRRCVEFFKRCAELAEQVQASMAERLHLRAVIGIPTLRPG